MWTNIVFAIFLMALSAALSLQHWRAWKRISAHHDANDRTLEFARRQVRRRMQASAMIGLIGVAVLGGIWVTGPLQMLLYWIGVLLAAVWIVLLAAADVISIRAHFGALENRQLQAYAALQEEMKQVQSGRRDSLRKPGSAVDRADGDDSPL